MTTVALQKFYKILQGNKLEAKFLGDPDNIHYALPNIQPYSNPNHHPNLPPLYPCHPVNASASLTDSKSDTSSATAKSPASGCSSCPN